MESLLEAFNARLMVDTRVREYRRHLCCAGTIGLVLHRGALELAQECIGKFTNIRMLVQSVKIVAGLFKEN